MAKERTIAERIRAARQDLGLSRSQAAKAWKLSTRTIEAWEQGRRREPAPLYREKLEKVLKRIEEKD